MLICKSLAHVMKVIVMQSENNIAIGSIELILNSSNGMMNVNLDIHSSISAASPLIGQPLCINDETGNQSAYKKN